MPNPPDSSNDSPVPFELLDSSRPDEVLDPEILERLPFLQTDRSFRADARRFAPSPELVTAIHVALHVGEPLLLMGDSGTGKTQAAYYAAYKLGVEPVLHFQVKSDSRAEDLLYTFDPVHYFSDAQVRQPGEPRPDKAAYVKKGPFWQAMASPHRRVLLIDEIDKAPRDFPNDLLHELDKMEFTVKETGETVGKGMQRPIVFITSNGDRELPAPFLRRCAFHFLELNEELLLRAVDQHRDTLPNLSPSFRHMAARFFHRLRSHGFSRPPATGELLVWLLALSVAEYDEERLRNDLRQGLPFRGLLIKDREDERKLDNLTRHLDPPNDREPTR